MRRESKFTDSLYKVVVRFGNCFLGDRKITKRCGHSIFNAHNICVPFWLSYMLVVKDGK